MSYYGWILLASLAFPLAWSFESRVRYVSRWIYLFPGIAIILMIFIPWDTWFVKQGIWGFNPEYVGPTRIAELPIEEWAFFLVIPFCSVFIYECLKYYFPANPLKRIAHHLTTLFIVIGSLMLILGFGNAYTTFNSLLAIALLLIHRFYLRTSWMGWFWLAYGFHLIPFILVNGLLTGMATDQPVVWYNDTAILGWRIITIPVEDFLYALSCLLIPVTVMEYLSARKLQASVA